MNDKHKIYLFKNIKHNRLGENQYINKLFVYKQAACLINLSSTGVTRAFKTRSISI